MFNPLRITAWLQCGANGEKSFPFDQILFHVAMRVAYGVEPAAVPLAALGRAPVRLPLAICNEGPQWYYAASHAQWSHSTADMTTYWHKRFDLSLVDLLDPENKQQKVRVDAMRYKAYRMPQFLRHSLSLCWFVVGAADDIERLLRHVTHIGKKTAQGDGAILRWEVAPWPDDWSVWGPAGKLMRNIPAAHGPLMGFRPSYWDRSNQTHCLSPDAR